MKSRHLTKVTNNKHLPQAPSVIVSHDKTVLAKNVTFLKKNNGAKILFSSIIQEE